MAGKTLRSLFVVLGAQFKDFYKDMEKAGRQWERFGRKMKKTGEQWTRVISLPIVGLGAIATYSANEVDKGLATIRAGTGA